MNIELLGSLLMVYIRANYPNWPYESIGQDDLRNVAAIFRELDPMPDEQFEEILETLFALGPHRPTPLLERLAIVWARSHVQGWPQQRPGEQELRDALAVLRKVASTTDAQVEDVVRHLLYENFPEGWVF